MGRLTAITKQEYLKEHLIDGVLVVGDTPMKLGIKMSSYYIKPADIDLRTITDRRIQEGIAIAYISVQKNLNAGMQAKVMRDFISGLTEEIRGSYVLFMNTLKNVQDHCGTEFKIYRTWYRHILEAELVGITSDEAEETYYQHCHENRIIDTYGVTTVLHRKALLNENSRSKQNYFHDVSWLNDEISKGIATFVYETVKSKALTQEQVDVAVKSFVKLKDEVPEYAQKNLLTLVTWLIENHPNITFTERFTVFLKDYLSQEDVLMSTDLDGWKFEWFDNYMHGDRMYFNHSHIIKFGGIEDGKTKYLCKKYIYYLITATDRACNTISDIARIAVDFFSEMDVSIEEIDTNIALSYAEETFNDKYENNGDKKLSMGYVATIVSRLCDAFNYFVAHEFLEENPFFYVKQQFKQGTREIYKRKPLSSFVLSQIFKVLFEHDNFEEVLIFLLMFDTGLRVIDATRIRRADLVVNGRTERGSFKIENAELYYYNHKFVHESVVFVSTYIAMLLDAHRSRTSPKSKYLFTQKRYPDKPISSYVFRRHMQAFFEKKHIVNEDGTPFRFLPHELRHTVACRMYAYGVGIQAISQQLDHQSIEMTWHYLNTLDATVYEKNLKFLDANGHRIEFSDGLIGEFGGKYNVAQALDKLNGAILPNGICKRPAALGGCENYCCCINLGCPNFVTDKNSLPVHEQQYEAEKQIAYDPERSEPERQTALYNMQKLAVIIEQLKVPATNDNGGNSNEQRQRLS